MCLTKTVGEINDFFFSEFLSKIKILWVWSSGPRQAGTPFFRWHRALGSGSFWLLLPEAAERQRSCSWPGTWGRLPGQGNGIRQVRAIPEPRPLSALLPRCLAGSQEPPRPGPGLAAGRELQHRPGVALASPAGRPRASRQRLRTRRDCVAVIIIYICAATGHCSWNRVLWYVIKGTRSTACRRCGSRTQTRPRSLLPALRGGDVLGARGNSCRFS